MNSTVKRILISFVIFALLFSIGCSKRSDSAVTDAESESTESNQNESGNGDSDQAFESDFESTDESNDENKEENLHTEPYYINLDGYTVIYPEGTGDNFKSYLERFCELLREYTGADIALKSDLCGVGEKEILLGNTNRRESNDANAELAEKTKNYDSFIIRNYGESIVIGGRREKVVLRAMKRFLMNYAKACETDKSIIFPFGEREIDTVDVESLLFENFTEISIGTQSEMAKMQSSTAENSNVYSYESIIELAHNGEDNGTLIATYTVYNRRERRIYKSNDGGETWKCISYVYNTSSEYLSKYSMQATLFELPRDMGRFKEGTLFMADSTYADNAEGIETTAITLYYSTDKGESWKSYCKLKDGLNYSLHLGVYEPYLYYDDVTERVYCFYADETYPKSADITQKLVCHYTDDMDNWSETVDVINGDDELLRPGMPCVTKMGNGEYFLVYEIYHPEEKRAPVYYQKLESLEGFRSKDYGVLLETDDGKRLSASPWCVWTPMGGECGTLFVVGCGMNEGKAIWGQSDIFVSFDYGENFTAIKNPVQVLSYGVRKIGYSPSIFASADGMTIHYCVNTANYNCEVSVMYTAIKIW